MTAWFAMLGRRHVLLHFEGLNYVQQQAHCVLIVHSQMAMEGEG